MHKNIWLIMILITMISLVGCGTGKASEESTQSTEPTETTEIIETTEATEAPETTEATSEGEVSASDIIDRDREINSYYYEYVMSSDGAQLASFKLWADGNKIRYDAIGEGQSIYLDYDKGEGYVYMAAENQLIKTPLGSVGNEWESPFLFAGQIDETDLASMLMKGTETIDGKTCYVFTADNFGTKITYYVWKEEGLIIKMLMEVDGQPSYEYYFKDLEIDGNFEKELELPEGATVIGG